MEKHNQIFNSIFKQSLFDDGSKALIEKATQEYPYFSAAQLFLLHHTDKNSIAYAEQAKKTSLLFNNNYWLNFQLLELSRLEKDFTTNNQVLPEPTIELPEENISVVESENIIAAISDTIIPTSLENETEPASFSVIENELSTEEGAPGALQDGPSNETTTEIVSNLTEAVIDTNEEIAESRSTPTETIAATDFTQHTNKSEEKDYQNEEPAAPILDEDELPVDGDELPIDKEMMQVSAKIAETLSAITIDSNSTADTISFEPLHTSDYFASVGIKLSEEIKPSDRLGLQMKSFTQWLKTMKKVHADQLTDTGLTNDQLNVQNDQTIQQLAEASNKENIVVTEAMAEVLLQQGKINKAIEVYEKLSLLDPSKKAYFAARLKQLKG